MQMFASFAYPSKHTEGYAANDAPPNGQFPFCKMYWDICDPIFPAWELENMKRKSINMVQNVFLRTHGKVISTRKVSQTTC